MISFRSSLGAVGVFCLLNACSNPISKTNEALAPKFIGDSFIVDKGLAAGVRNERLIGIKRSSLEKEFLLQGEIIVQPVVAQYNGLKSRIVTFKESGGHLHMLEATDGHSSSSSIPQHIVLAQFTVVQERDGVLFFDFAEGMSKIFMAMDWYGTDPAADTAKYQSQSAWTTVNLSTSYIEEAGADADNNLVIRQIAQIEGTHKGKAADDEDSASATTLQIPVELKYYLTPYRENPGFVSRESTGMDKVGFFEISPRLLAGGGQTILATRWDERKPITYAVSANTPTEFVQAIKDGVLYWNRAFGKEVVRVIDAPAGVVAPDFHYNLVQWVDWNDAGYAYADAQMDPRTGEILHASVFLTSIFGFSAKNKARQLLRRLNFDNAQKANAPSHLSLAGFQQQHLCDFEPSHALADTLTDVLNEIENNRLDESVLLKIAQDTVRETVAHEIGHTLGLRHNFAGSLASNIPNEKRDEVLKQYLSEGKAPEGMQPSSSVMDYEVFQDSLLVGDQIATGKPALDYDGKAIQTLYFGKTFQDMPLFCTDSHTTKYLDCTPFDYGASELAFIKSAEQKAFESLPYTLMERFIAAKSTIPGQKPVTLEKALPSTVALAASILLPRIKVLKAISEGARFLKAGVDPAAQQNYIEEEIKKGGGLNEFLNPLRMAEIKKAASAFETLVDNDIYTRNVGPGGNYEFTAEEKALIKQKAKKFFASLPMAFIIADLQILKKAENIADHALGNELADIFAQRAKFLIETSSGAISSEFSRMDGTKYKVDVPNYLFPLDIRLQGASLLHKRSDDVIWGLKARASLRKELKLKADDAFKTDTSKLSIEDLPDDFARWLLENRKVIDALETKAE